MANPTPANTPLPDVPLNADLETTAWMQEVSADLNQILLAKGPPSLVTGLTATANSATIVLRWNAAHNASIYRLYRNTTGDFNSASVVQTVGASKTGVASLSCQDSQDQTQAQRFYWVQAVNERGMTGPQSQMVVVTNFKAASGSTSLGVAANASGTNSTALGTNSSATAANTTALGISAVASAADATALGKSATASGADSSALGAGSIASATSSTALGEATLASAVSATAVGVGSVASNTHAVSIGAASTASGVDSVALGTAVAATGDNAVSIGLNSQAAFSYSTALGTSATTTVAHQLMKGGQAGYLDQEASTTGSNGEQFALNVLRELTTITTGAFTDTTIKIPVNAVVYGVSLLVVTTIPTAGSFTYGINGAVTRYCTLPISTSAGTTNPGTDDGTRFYAGATAIRIVPNAAPATNAGQVRVAIYYYSITPATS